MISLYLSKTCDDMVFLDFARAFDKVDHEILMQKIVKQNIKGKIAYWLMEFLNNRKFCPGK